MSMQELEYHMDAALLNEAEKEHERQAHRYLLEQIDQDDDEYVLVHYKANLN